MRKLNGTMIEKMLLNPMLKEFSMTLLILEAFHFEIMSSALASVARDRKRFTTSTTTTAALDSDLNPFYYLPDGETNETYILEKCPHVSPNRLHPIDPGHPLAISLYFQPEYFNGIDDVAETVSVSALFSISWEVQCLEYGEGYRYFDPITPPLDLFFKPRVRHLNAVDDPGSTSGFDVFFQIQSSGVDPEYPEAENLQFRWDRYGIFKSFCDISLSDFPFGEMECSFEFVSTLYESRIKIQSANFAKFPQPYLKKPQGTWVYVRNRTTIDTYLDGNARKYNRGSFLMTFHRLPDYFIYNLLAPCCVLALLELFCLFLPARYPERPGTAITILLSLTVVQGQVLSNVPLTSERIFLNDYVLLSCLFAASVTVYTFITCYLYHTFRSLKTPKWHLVGLKKFPKICVLRACDIVAATFGLLMLSGINVYAWRVAIQYPGLSDLVK